MPVKTKDDAEDLGIESKVVCLRSKSECAHDGSRTCGRCGELADSRCPKCDRWITRLDGGFCYDCVPPDLDPRTRSVHVEDRTWISLVPMGCVHEWGCDECDRAEELVECARCHCLGDFVSLCGTCREEFRSENDIGFDEWSLVNQAAGMPVVSDSSPQERLELY